MWLEATPALRPLQSRFALSKTRANTEIPAHSEPCPRHRATASEAGIPIPVGSNSIANADKHLEGVFLETILC